MNDVFIPLKQMVVEKLYLIYPDLKKRFAVYTYAISEPSDIHGDENTRIETLQPCEPNTNIFLIKKLVFMQKFEKI